MNCDRRMLKSSNKNKTTWNIINLDIGTNFSNGDIQVLDIKGKPLYYQQAFADAFTNYFLPIADNYQV